MGELSLTEEMLKAEITQGREAAAQADKVEPRAHSAYYDAQSKRIVIELRNGASFLLPPELIQGLEGESFDDLTQVEVTPSGEGLHWENLDVDISIPSLMMGIFGTKMWMAELGSKGGAVSSEAKKKAARENGKRGGRPKKNTIKDSRN